MPKKLIEKTESILDRKYEFDIQKLMNNSDSYKSLIYGIVTVVVLFVVVALGVRTMSQNRAQIDDEAVMTQKTIQENNSRYTVSEGETLWSIAEKSYNDGFKWGEIARANNIENPETLEAGTTLIIPKITQEGKAVAMETAKPTVEPVIQGGGQKITSNSYVIVSGDCLWEVAVRAYGDGYRWVEIARANDLVNPDLIFAGNQLRIPRP